MDKQILKGGISKSEIKHDEKKKKSSDREVLRDRIPMGMDEDNDVPGINGDIERISVSFMNRELTGLGMASDSVEVTRALYLVGVDGVGTNAVLKSGSFKSKLLKIRNDTSISGNSDRVKKLKLALATKEELEKELRRIEALIGKTNSRTRIADAELMEKYRERLQRELNLVKSRDAVLQEEKADTVMKNDVNWDQETKDARKALVTLVDKLDEKFAALIGQINERSDSTLFKNMCTQIIEFRSFAKSKDFDPGKEMGYARQLSGLRAAVAAYFNHNNKFKATKKGRVRRDMSRDILEAIDKCLVDAPDFVSDAVGYETEMTKEGTDTFDFDSTKELYKKIALKRFKEKNPNTPEEELKSHVNADTFRMIAIKKRDYNVGKTVSGIFDEKKIERDSDLGRELARTKSDMYGKIVKNHDGSYSDDSMVMAEILKSTIDRYKNGDVNAFDGYFNEVLKKTLNIRFELKDFLYENLNKNLVGTSESALLLTQIQNLFFDSTSKLGMAFYDKLPPEIKDRLKAVDDANIFSACLGDIFERYNLKESGDPLDTGLSKYIPDLTKIGNLPEFLIKNPTKVGDIKVEKDYFDETINLRHFTSKTKKIGTIMDYNRMQSYLFTLKPEDVIDQKKKSDYYEHGVRYKNYTQAREKLMENRDFSNFENPLSFARAEYKNNRISDDSLIIISGIQKSHAYIDNLKTLDGFKEYDLTEDKKKTGTYDKFKDSGLSLYLASKLIKPVKYTTTGKISPGYRDNNKFNDKIFKTILEKKSFNDGELDNKFEIFDEVFEEFNELLKDSKLFSEENLAVNIDKIIRVQNIASLVSDRAFTNVLAPYISLNRSKPILHNLVNKAKFVSINIEHLALVAKEKYGVDLNEGNILHDVEALEETQVSDTIKHSQEARDEKLKGFPVTIESKNSEFGVDFPPEFLFDIFSMRKGYENFTCFDRLMYGLPPIAEMSESIMFDDAEKNAYGNYTRLMEIKDNDDDFGTGIQESIEGWERSRMGYFVQGLKDAQENLDSKEFKDYIEGWRNENWENIKKDPLANINGFEIKDPKLQQNFKVISAIYNNPKKYGIRMNEGITLKFVSEIYEGVMEICLLSHVKEVYEKYLHPFRSHLLSFYDYGVNGMDKRIADMTDLVDKMVAVILNHETFKPDGSELMKKREGYKDYSHNYLDMDQVYKMEFYDE